MGAGTTFTKAVKLLGRRLESASEVAEYEPNRRFALKHAPGPVSLAEDVFTFEPVAGGTKVTHVVEAETGGFFKLAEPIVARQIRRQWGTNFALLKELLEAQG